MEIKLKQKFASGSLGTQICEIDIDETAAQNSQLSSDLIQDIKNGFYIGKCIPKSCKFSLKLLNNEEEILKQLNHSNIIKMAGSSETEDQKILVLEKFCSDLDYFINQNSQPLPTFDLFELKTMISDITNALEYLHLKKISHNDIKPWNILCDENNNLVLSDFGTAFNEKEQNQEKLYDTLSIMNKTYLAPEILDLLESKISTINPMESDIFSFGLVIFQLMFGGQMPYDCSYYASYDKKFALLHSNPDQFFQKSEFSQYISYWKNQCGFKYTLFVDFIQGILNPDPKKRMTATTILDHQWLESC